MQPDIHTCSGNHSGLQLCSKPELLSLVTISEKALFTELNMVAVRSLLVLNAAWALFMALSMVLIYSLHYTTGLQPGCMQCVT